jgi:outer membrane protein assembly factor BamA
MGSFRKLLILGLISSFCCAFAENSGDSLKLNKTRKGRWLLLPILLRSPVTRWGGGIAQSYIFPASQRDSISRASNIESFGLYTENRQIILLFGCNVYTHDEKYIIHWRNSFSNFPDKFWGVGNFTGEENKESYSFQQFLINPQILRKISRKFYAGLFYEYQKVYSIQYTSGGRFDSENISGRKGSEVSGLGAILAWDSRDHAFSPGKGFFIQFTAAQFSPVFKSQYSFFNYQLDLRNFYTLFKKHVLAFQVMGYLTSGNVPLRNLALLGGSDIMRGYYAGRYRDKDILATQAEYRFPVYKKFGLVFFAGGGRVSDRLKNFTLNGIRYSVGGGIRFALKPEDKLNLRVDYGMGYKSRGLYVTVAESF